MNELGKLYGEQGQQAQSAHAAFQTAILSKRKETNKDNLVRDLKDLLNQKVQIQCMLHQKDLESLQQLQKWISDNKIEGFKEINMSELKSRQDRETIEIQESHKQQKNSAVVFLEGQRETCQADLSNPLDQLGHKLAAFKTGLKSENQQEIVKVQQKFLSELQAAEERIQKMIREVKHEPLLDM